MKKKLTIEQTKDQRRRYFASEILKQQEKINNIEDVCEKVGDSSGRVHNLFNQHMIFDEG